MTVNNNGGVYGAQLSSTAINIGSINATENATTGVYIPATATSGTIGAITVTGNRATAKTTSYGLQLVGTGLSLGDISVSDTGTAASGICVYITSAGSNTIGSITCSNTGGGISIPASTASQTITGNLVVHDTQGANAAGIDVRATGVTVGGTISVYNNTGNGLIVYSTNFTANGNIYSYNNATNQVQINGNSNIFGDMYIANGTGLTGRGLYMTSAKMNRFGYVMIFNNPSATNSASLSLSGASDYNTFRGVLISGGGGAPSNTSTRGMYLLSSVGNIFGPSTIANSANPSASAVGINMNGASSIFLGALSINNESDGLNITSPGGTFVNFASAHNGGTGVKMNSSTASATFLGNLVMSSNTGLKCSVGTGTGLINSTCTSGGSAGNAGTHSYSTSNSNAVLRLPSSLASSVVGKVNSDTANTTDSSGTGAYSASTLDFVNFDNIFRGWGKDGSAFPNADNRGICQSGTCRIWDWSLSASDTAILNHSGSTKSTCASATCPAATEVYGDSVGDDDGVCEISEDCYNDFNGDDNLNGVCDSTELCDVTSGINTFSSSGACPVEVRGSEYVYSEVYTYNVSYTAGLNGVEMLDGSDGTCEAGEVCHESGNLCTTAAMTCMQKFLKGATEVAGTGGDSDYLCEQGETCVYTPNIGIYQGHGALDTCTFDSNGGLSGITMYGYEYNGR